MTAERAIELLEYIKTFDGMDFGATKIALDMAIESLGKQIPKRVVSYSDDESNHVFCPCCNECIGSNEIIYDDFYLRGWSVMYCQECGQAMIWK